jgi:hypothetical protein
MSNFLGGASVVGDDYYERKQYIDRFVISEMPIITTENKEIKKKWRIKRLVILHEYS